jgi:rhodanese-related sulfurtransferase
VKFFVDNWILILVAFVSGAMLVWPMVRRGGGATSVNTGEAVRLINREKGVLIDVGEPAEFAAGHAAGARSVPFGQLEGSKELPTNKALPLLVMCPSGGRAARAAALLRKAGHERAVAVSGGTAAWRDAQLPVERSAVAGQGDKAGAKGGDSRSAEKADKAEQVERAEKSDKADKVDKAEKASGAATEKSA